MAWWYARLLFHGDRLIDAGLHDMLPSDVRLDTDPALAPDGEALTSVCVSGYALYGKVRGYYAVGIGHFRLDPLTHRAYATDASANHAEPAGTLTAAQRDQVRAWLIDHDAGAWASSLDSFRRALGESHAAVPEIPLAAVP